MKRTALAALHVITYTSAFICKAPSLAHTTRLNCATTEVGVRMNLESSAVSRRSFLSAPPLLVAAAIGVGSTVGLPEGSSALDVLPYADSRGYFEINMPVSYTKAERDGSASNKGVIFVGGNFFTAEIIGIAVLSAAQVLKESGFEVADNVRTWESFGKPAAVARLLAQLRDSGNPTTGESVVLDDTIEQKGDTLTFMIKTPIKVMKPDQLEAEKGVRELYRLTYAKGIMRGDGTFLLCWAGALNTDWEGPDGAKERLGAAVASLKKGP